jgi:glycosyltransferase involved in cell wall biosynthesis
MREDFRTDSAEFIRARTALVIPAFNAAAHLAAVIDAAKEHVPVSRIIVVDDGSTDGTADVARGSGAVVLQHPENRGKGVALETGILQAARRGWEYAITIDADGQHDPGEIPLFLEKAARTGADIVVGNRMAARKNMPGDRVFANKVTSWFVSARSGVHIPDSQNGYRLLKTALYRELRITAKRYAAESEILIRAGRAGARIEWVPVETIYGGEKSSVNPVIDTLRFLKLAVRSLFW